MDWNESLRKLIGPALASLDQMAPPFVTPAIRIPAGFRCPESVRMDTSQNALPEADIPVGFVANGPARAMANAVWRGIRLGLADRRAARQEQSGNHHAPG